MEDHVAYLQSCMYQYSRAIYRSIKDLIDPYADVQTRLESRRACWSECELTMSRLAADPHYFAKSGPRPLPGHPPLLPDHGAGPGRVGRARGRRCGVRFIEAADRGRRSRRRRRPLPGHHAEGQAVPAHAAARAATTARRTSTSRPRSRCGLVGRGVRLQPDASRFTAPAVSSPHAVSHDTDKLIRQLSLVAFLMAERRPLTARDVKDNVEGYSEMSDEAFARRYYSDRAELIGLGVPLHSQRDEFTGEELYTLRSEKYFLPARARGRRARGAADALFYLEGKFAYAEPLRLALQNLALGRPGCQDAPTETAERVRGLRPRLLARDRRAAREARERDLEAAHDQVQLLVASRDEVKERTLNPYALRLDEGVWYVIGHDLDRDDARTFRVSRIRSDIRFATRRERDFRHPGRLRRRGVPRPAAVADRRRRSARRASRCSGDTAWWVAACVRDARTLEDDIFETPYSRIEPLAGLDPAPERPRRPLGPEALRARSPTALARSATRTTASGTRRRASAASRRPTARRAARRPGRAGALRRPPGAARVPALRLWRRARGGDPRRPRARRAVHHPARGAPGAPLAAEPRQLRRRLLRRLRRARRGDGTVHVDKELYGDIFRQPPS